jgi:hypothetical protein
LPFHDLQELCAAADEELLSERLQEDEYPGIHGSIHVYIPYNEGPQKESKDTVADTFYMC